MAKCSWQTIISILHTTHRMHDNEIVGDSPHHPRTNGYHNTGHSANTSQGTHPLETPSHLNTHSQKSGSRQLQYAHQLESSPLSIQSHHQSNGHSFSSRHSSLAFEPHARRDTFHSLSQPALNGLDGQSSTQYNSIASWQTRPGPTENETLMRRRRRSSTASSSKLLAANALRSKAPNTPHHTRRFTTLISDQEPDTTYLWGYLLFFCTMTGFTVSMYALVASNYMPLTGNKTLDWIKQDSHYCMLVPVTIPVTVLAVGFNWLGMKLFRHN